MAKFKIKENVQIMTAFIYEVEADTKEEALEKYVNELAGSLPVKNSFVTCELEESIIAYNPEDYK
tara:strand:- start:4347 stop:4541 length:195 start_codon:yes stop_codon:yes gene_type:complete